MKTQKYYYQKPNLHKLWQWLRDTITEHTEKGKVYEVTIKEYNKRSNNANGLYWSVIEQIASEIGYSNDDVHRDMIMRYSSSEIVSVIASVDVSDYFKYYDKYGEGDVNGKHFIHYRVYKGSSDMNTQEFSRLLDGALAEANELGIKIEKEI